jgi:hypothetical protein
MVNTMPNPIKEYYIAYFDILGYTDFFENYPEKVSGFLTLIHEAISRAKEHVDQINQSPLLGTYANIDLKVKIFSDNALICMEASNEPVEPVRVLAFIKAVSDIQRGFVLSYGLFVRGGIVKGQLSFNDDYVFGKGLIDAVQLEGAALYPRIVIHSIIVNYLKEYRSCPTEDVENALHIEKLLSSGEEITDIEREQYEKTKNSYTMDFLLQKATDFTMFLWSDDCWVVDYLHIIELSDLVGQETSDLLCKLISDISPDDAAKFMPKEQGGDQRVLSFDEILRRHKTRVEEQLSKFGKNDDIALNDTKLAELREKVLRKYIWVMAFHNYTCRKYQKPEHIIQTKCNCDTRFLKMTIEVINDEAGI